MFTPLLESWGADYCSGYTYSLSYVSGSPLTANYGSDLYTEFQLNTPAQNTIDVLLEDLSWVGSHDIQITGCLGNAAGAFNFPTNCASSTWTVVVTNPCESSSFNTDYPVLSISYNVANDKEGIQYLMPTDDASLTYGNGFDKCGSRVHYLVSDSGVKIYPETRTTPTADFRATSTYPFLEFLYFPDGDSATFDTTPLYQINVQTEAQSFYGLHQFELKFEFADYPDSTANDASDTLSI